MLRNAPGLLNTMRNQQNCAACFFTIGTNQFFSSQGGFHVHCCCRFIKDQKTVRLHQQTGKSHLCCFPAREFFGWLSAQTVKMQRIHQSCRAIFVIAVEENVVRGAHAKSIILLRHVTDCDIRDDFGILISLLNAGKNLCKARFSTSVGTCDSRDRSFRYFKAGEIQHLAFPICFA